MVWTEHKVKILSVALLLSLAVNGGLIAFMAGRHTGHAFQHRHRGALMAAVRTLPQDQRQAAEQIMRAHRKALQQAVKAVREERDTIRVLASKEVIDRKAMAAAFAELRVRTGKAEEAGQALALELLPRIPPEQRRKFLRKKGRMMP